MYGSTKTQTSQFFCEIAMLLYAWMAAAFTSSLKSTNSSNQTIRGKEIMIKLTSNLTNFITIYRSLDLMNRAAKYVMNEFFPDITMAYGNQWFTC